MEIIDDKYYGLDQIDQDLRKQRIKGNKHWKQTTKESNYTQEILSRIRRRAKSRKLEFNLTIEDIQIPEYCPILGIKLDIRGDKDTLPSVDRIDNSRGYTKDNIHVISNRANCIKRDATKEELKKLSDYFN